MKKIRCKTMYGSAGGWQCEHILTQDEIDRGDRGDGKGYCDYCLVRMDTNPNPISEYRTIGKGRVELTTDRDGRQKTRKMPW